MEKKTHKFVVNVSRTIFSKAYAEKMGKFQRVVLANQQKMVYIAICEVIANAGKIKLDKKSLHNDNEVSFEFYGTLERCQQEEKKFVNMGLQDAKKYWEKLTTAINEFKRKLPFKKRVEVSELNLSHDTLLEKLVLYAALFAIIIDYKVVQVEE